MNPEQLSQSQLMGLRWMTQYAIRNPGSLQTTRDAPADATVEASPPLNPQI